MMYVENPHNRRALVCIDPGRALGWSLLHWTGAPSTPWVLQDCGLVRAKSRDVSAQAAETLELARGSVLRAVRGLLSPAEKPLVVVEFMQWRPDDRKSEPNDLIRVATMGAAVAGLLSTDVRLVPARTWKGSIPWEVSCSRSLAALRPEESAVYVRSVSEVPDDLRDNVIDAIGLGMWTVGRAHHGGF